MPKLSVSEIEQKAAQMRTDILRMTNAAGSGHPGGSLSAADIMAVLYFGNVLRYDSTKPDWPLRDRFILSKGHAAPVLYAALARAGFLPLEELLTLRKFNSRLQGHPDMHKCPGVEVSTGSLGQGLSIACGLAYALLCEQSSARVFTLLGDGECQEGQVWEAAMFAAHNKLNNLTAIVDLNGLQIDGATKDVMSLGSLADKFRAFGWQVSEVDGHDVNALLSVLPATETVFGASSEDAKEATTAASAPRAIIAHTVKGRGISFMAGQASWHGKAPNAEEVRAGFAELASLYGPPDEFTAELFQELNQMPLAQPSSAAPAAQPLPAAPLAQPSSAAPSEQPLPAAPLAQPLPAAPLAQPSSAAPAEQGSKGDKQ